MFRGGSVSSKASGEPRYVCYNVHSLKLLKNAVSGPCCCHEPSCVKTLHPLGVPGVTRGARRHGMGTLCGKGSFLRIVGWVDEDWQLCNVSTMPNRPHPPNVLCSYFINSAKCVVVLVRKSNPQSYHCFF
jgi:hypothetical protein